MNTNNPSQRTEHPTCLLASADGAEQNQTVEGTADRTYNFIVASNYEAWQLFTFLGRAGESLTGAAPPTLGSRHISLTLRPKTLRASEVHWLAKHAFQLTFGSHSLNLTASQRVSAAHAPRPEVLDEFLALVHGYLIPYDVIAMVKHLAPTMDRTHFDVAALNIPLATSDTEKFKSHLRVCMNCVRLSYLDDGFLR